MHFLKQGLAILLSSLALHAWAADVNKDDAAALSTIKGIGPATAERIVAERKSGGNFKSWDDLIARVSGVGEKSAAKFSADGLKVGGSAYKPPAAAAKSGGKDDKKK
ncbi:MAG: helix-hairpin-helix domain-containing protein [Comamonas sp.]